MEADPPRPPAPGRKPARQGTGLGLSVTAALVNVLGGSVSVESAPGRGTVMRSRVPAAQDLRTT